MNGNILPTTQQTADSLMNYLQLFLSQSEAGLIISESFEGLRILSSFLKAQGLKESYTAESCLETLANRQSAFVVLTPPLDTQIYYLLSQYARQPGVIKLLNRRKFELAHVSVEPAESHLLFIVTRSDLLAIEERHCLRDKIGFIQRFSPQEHTTELQCAYAK